MDLTTFIGVAASTFTSLALLPQLVKIIRERKAGDVSTGMLGVLLAGLGLWIYYGALKNDWIIIISNSIAVLINLATTVLTYVFKPQKKRQNVPRKHTPSPNEP
jgi:MtN3 and saliva related transmembrane protein